MPQLDSPAPLFRRSQLAALLVIFAVAGALFYKYRLFFHDDAFISLRYVQTFLGGGGLCWNPGERVEGYTNFLFVILTSAMGKCGVDLVVGARLLGIGSYLLLVAFSVRRLFRPGNSHSVNWLAMVPLIISATALPLIIWTLGGLETTLFTLLVTLGTVAFAEAISDHRRSLLVPSLYFGLATLCRPDGIVFIICGLVMIIAKSMFVERRIDRRVWSYLFITAALTIPHELWRYSYYGQWLPNTFLVKGANLGSAAVYGWQYVKDFAGALPFLPVVLSVVGTVAIFARAWRPGSIWYAFVMLSFGAYVFGIGGDHMPGFRLFAPLIPIGGFLLYELLSDIKMPERSTYRFAVACGVLLLCTGQLFFPSESYERAKIRDGAAFLGEQVGKYINANWPAGSVVALNTAGSTPYFAPKLRFIDMLGLNDTTIARRSNVPMRTKMQEWPGHQKGDGLYVLSRKPDYIIIGPANGDYANNFPWFLSDYELGGSEQFLREYESVKVIISATAQGYKNYTESALGALRFVYYQRKK